MLGSFIKKSQFFFIASFAAGIVLGTLLLRLPFVKADGEALKWIDALFTATSAVCVTGLATVPLSEFSMAGQLIVLGLIQIGGLGVITLSVSIILFLGRNMSWRDTRMLSAVTEKMECTPEMMARDIVLFTAGTELLGFLLLFFGFRLDGCEWAKSLYYAFFFAVSAFCNAGMSPTDGSLIGMSVYLKLTVAALIVVGGIGIYTIYDLRMVFRRGQLMRINTRLVLTMTAALILFGMLGIKLFETRHGDGIGWIDALFQSVTARTAGFNSVDLTLLTPGAVTILFLLMLIGGSPGSTAGGMKTTTMALVIVALFNALKGNQKVLLFHREIPISNVLKAFTILVIFLMLAIFGAIGLQSCMPELSGQSAFFEIASALGTVGLSLGATPIAPPEAKLLLIFYMFIGRVGPFTLFLFLLGRDRSSRLTYPQENIIIG